ncbi:hypothetical protein NDU88_001859, partial [Pleurodeles waltl]
ELAVCLGSRSEDVQNISKELTTTAVQNDAGTSPLVKTWLASLMSSRQIHISLKTLRITHLRHRPSRWPATPPPSQSPQGTLQLVGPDNGWHQALEEVTEIENVGD